LKLKATLESYSSYLTFNRLHPGAFNLGSIGSTCAFNVVSWGQPTPSYLACALDEGHNGVRLNSLLTQLRQLGIIQGVAPQVESESKI
jgi:hypothetical protein